MIDREKALDYIETAAHQWIKGLVKYDIEQQRDIKDIKTDIDYHDKIMKYIEENLK
jgi:hypothetical protein